MQITTVTAKERILDRASTAELTTGGCPQLSYILITPAHNEEALIAITIDSVVNQTAPPLKWIIVDDGSTDRTAAIVRNYLPSYKWIELVQIPHREDRSFSAKVRAFNAGYERVKNLQYDIVGNVDADVSFAPNYLEFILSKFAADPALGVSGTVFKEEGYSSERDSFEGQNHVAGGCQLFRKRCFEQIGGFKPNKAGGVDWMAVTTARMLGWKTRAFREMSFFHHRHLGTAELSRVPALFTYGKRDYYLGGHPVWEIFRVAYTMTKTPYMVGGLSLGLGYGYAMLRRIKRPVSNELMAFHRKEQMRKLQTILKTVLAFKPIDSFTVLHD
jgi:glycosyltransferase involved in cell wall biosynthesis